MSKKSWVLVFIGITVIIASLVVYANLSPDKIVLKNNLDLPMRVWIEKERKVVVRSNSPKVNEVFRFMVISTNHRLERVSEQDALWESCSGGECLYFRLTDVEPLGS